MILSICLFIFTYGINAINFFFTAIINNSKLSISGLNEISLFGQHHYWLLFFILGAFLHNSKQQIEKTKGIRLICLIEIILSLTALVLIKYSINGTFEWRGLLLENGYGRLCTFIMSICIFVFMQNISIKNKYVDKIINEIGSSTLGIYYIHMPLLLIFNKYLYKLIGIRGFTINFLKTIVVILISYGFVRIIKKIPTLKKIVA